MGVEANLGGRDKSISDNIAVGIFSHNWDISRWLRIVFYSELG